MSTVPSTSDLLLTSAEQCDQLLREGRRAARRYSRSLPKGAAQRLLIAALMGIDESVAGLRDRNVNVAATLAGMGVVAPAMEPPPEPSSEARRLTYAACWLRFAHLIGHVNATALLDQLAALEA